MLAIGLMSGTSADGIDAAAIELPDAGPIRFLAHRHTPYSAELRRRVLALAGDVPVHTSETAASSGAAPAITNGA